MKNHGPSLVVLALITVFSVGQSTAQVTKAYVAEINGMNPDLTHGEVTGNAIFIIENGELSISLAVNGLSPGMMHLQHIHGFVDGKKSTCPTRKADINNDGVVDLIETELFSGTTLVPFNGSPVDLQIKSDTYPVANKDGLIVYKMTVPLKELKEAIKKQYGVDQLSLENRVIYIHGIPDGDPLPDSVKSLPGVPASITVPVACGVIKAL